MSEKSHDKAPETTDATTATADHGHDHEHGHVHGPDCDHEHEAERGKAITIQVEDLTAEAKAEAEKKLHRPIPDRPYTVADRQTKPGSLVALAIEMAPETFREEQGTLLNDLRKDIVLPGFRKGKAPVGLILKRLGEEAVRDAIGALATNVMRQEQIKEKWSMLTNPQVIEFHVPAGDDEGPVRLQVEFEIEPQVELKKYKGLKVEVEKHEVGDKLVEARIEALRLQNAVQERAGVDHPLGEQDIVTVDVEVLNQEGERLQHLCRENQTLHDWRRELPQAIVEALPGKKIGETVSTMLTNETTNRRGEQVVHQDECRVTIRAIRVSRLPKLDDEFAKDLGEYDSLAALRKKTLDELEKEQEERRRGEALKGLYRQIVENNPFEVPKSLISRQQYEMIMQDSYQMQRFGLRLDQVVQDVDQYMVDQRSGADERVRLQFLLDALVKAENLEIGDADVDAEIEKLAAESGRKPLAIRARLEAKDQLATFRQTLSRKKLDDFLLANATVEYVAPKPPPEPASEPPVAKEKPKPAKKPAEASKPEPKAEAKPAAKAAAEEAKPKAKAVPKSGAQAEPKSEPKAKAPKTAAKAAPKPEAKAKPKPKSGGKGGKSK
jgi:trigger factor